MELNGRSGCTPTSLCCHYNCIVFACYSSMCFRLNVIHICLGREALTFVPAVIAVNVWIHAYTD